MRLQTGQQQFHFSTGNNTEVRTEAVILSVGPQVLPGLAQTVHASISEHMSTDAKGSVYDSLHKLHFCIFRVSFQ